MAPSRNPPTTAPDLAGADRPDIDRPGADHRGGIDGGSTAGTLPYIIGLDHQMSSPEIRDRLGGEAADLPAGLETLRAAGLDAAVLLATCDRVEICGTATDPEAAGRRGLEALARRAAMDPAALAATAYRLTGEAAVSHLFAVAASLESQVIGEPQVLGQVRAALQAARDHSLVPPSLGAVFEAALAAGKRVRSETTIGERPVSIASAALQAARNLHGDLGRCRGLLYGTGDMGETLARQFIAAGIGQLTVGHPSPRRAATLARDLGAHHTAVDEAGTGEDPGAEPLEALLAASDIVVCAFGTGRVRLRHDPVKRALRKRRYRPIFLVDSAVPGDIDPAVDRLDDAFHYTLEDLERLATEGRAGRRAEVDAAWAVLSEELEAWRQRGAERAGAPAVVALRDHFEAVRRQVLAELTGSGPVDADRATALLLARLLHGPSVALRAAAARGDAAASADLARAAARLFDLPDSMPAGDRAGGRKETEA